MGWSNLVTRRSEGRLELGKNPSPCALDDTWQGASIRALVQGARMIQACVRPGRGRNTGQTGWICPGWLELLVRFTALPFKRRQPRATSSRHQDIS